MPNTLVAPFGKLTIEDARTIINGATAALAMKINAFPSNLMLGMVDLPVIQPYRISQAFIAGDHWQGSSAWIGPRPDPTTDSQVYDVTMSEIARQFVSQNAIGEVTDRHVNGVIGVTPDFGFTSREPLAEGEELSDELQALVDDAEQRITVWWDRNGVLQTLHDFAVTMLIAERAALRLLVPRGKLVSRNVTNGQGDVIGSVREVRASTVDDALRVIWLEHPGPEQATVARDDDTKEEVGVVLVRRSDPTQPATNISGEERAEFTYLVGMDDKPLTRIRMVGNATSSSGEAALTLDLGGRITLYEAKRPLFVTPQMWQQQKALNLALSMIPRTVVTAGFLERTILNAQMPGHWEDKGLPTERWVPEPYYTGPGATNSLVGVVVRDPNTQAQTLATPSIEYRDPIDPEPLMKAANAHYVAILQEAKQQHILAIQNTQASGKTHEQARADFKTSLGRTRTAIESAGIWMLETLLAMAEQIAGDPGRYTTKLRATFQCHLDVGPVTSDVRAALDNSVKAGTLSRETAIMEAGTVDSDAELARLDSQPGANLDVLTRMFTALQTATASGASLTGAAEVIGFTEEEAALLADFSGDPTPAEQGLPDPNAPPTDPNAPPTGE